MKLALNITTIARASFARWRVFGAACLAHKLHDGYASMIYLLLPSWQTELALSLTQVGILKTVYSAAMAVGQVPAGRLSERWSERLPLVAGTFLTAAAVVALHWATTPLVLGLLLAVGGLGASAQHPLASTLIAKVYGGSELRLKLGTYNFAGDLGKMFFPAVLTVLIAAFGWRTGTLSIGVLGLVAAAMLLIILPARPRGPAREALHQAPHRPLMAEHLRRRSFAALSAVGMLDSATRTGFLTFLPFVLARKGADTAIVGTALSLVFAGGAVGKFACGALAIRVGILRTVAATELGTALSILSLLVLPLSVCLLLMPVLGIMLNGTSSVLYGTVPDLAPDGREARAFGFFYTVTIGADAIAPALYGRVADAVGLSCTIVLVTVVVLL
ncbi:MAG TPA: MFS transporter, partial [Xanthobacteraceae bacterium]|nr:MFS transporter [Xanthobacteraceae bacterium]